ncbi:DUF3667 domain-containing protein [Gelidibacter sp.]|uniref:DUF3667 domain-containing protein n=1 Tax=Gelidibacter sp. TaxID=2018083 RepID=UPI002C188C99|nr:DUF3667 domain-containing protein [Gelidibacter sp.]HUH27898.1 DUF3667 domain-containing protein [Gelidibacter sp.]
MSRSLKECNNCIQQFESHFPHCPYCGQKSGDNLTLNVLFNNTISNYFSVDARFFKSFIPLMVKPGYLPKQFIIGRRMMYLHPAQMYLFISIIFFFLFSFISRDQVEGFDIEIKKDIEQSNNFRDSIRKASQVKLMNDVYEPKIEVENSLVINPKSIDSITKKEKNKSNSIFNIPFNEMEIDSMVAAGASDEDIYKKLGMEADAGYFTKRVYKQILKFFKTKSAGSILQTFYDSIPLAMFILLPIFALILKLFYFRKGRFVHHLVFTFYFFAFLFCVFSWLVLANLIWKDFPGWIMTFAMFSIFFYLLFAIRRFYTERWLRSIIKSSAISFLFLSIVLPFTFLVMVVMAFLFY